MAIDYTAANNHYQYMDNLLKQIAGLSKSSASLYASRAGSVSGSSGFLSTLRKAESEAEAESDRSAGLNVPESMDAIFEEAAKLYDVPVGLLKAMGKAESGFDAGAVSGAGAMGVMQLMPATAASLGVEDAFDARSNIMGGAKYISEKLQQYGGDIDLALAAYNAGSGNVAKYGGVPPFAETQNYIRRIREYMGENITTGQTVYTKSSDSGNARSAEPLGNTYTGSSLGNALYIMELMRLQMQNRITMASQSLAGGEEQLL